MISGETVGKLLREQVRGEVWTDPAQLARLSRDQSIYRIAPLAAVVPQDGADVVAAVRVCRELSVPLTCRGGGSSTAGAALGRDRKSVV